MKTIVILCGVGEVGKTKTLKKFFGVSHVRRLRRDQLLERGLNGKKIYAVRLSSPQEQEDFCEIDDVKGNIKRRIQKCEQASKGQQYTLIVPFGLYGASKGKLNEECILKPIEWLRSQRFRVYVIYLRKRTARELKLLDSFMKELTSYVIQSTKEYDRQAKELENFIRTMLT